jgi:hypothetical protein
MLRVLVVGVLAWLGVQCAYADENVPDWFRFDAKQPYAIFDAWKELSTRKAATCVGENWKVIAGQLQNEQGMPIENTSIRFDLVSGKSFHANVQSDANGYFILYSPWDLKMDDDRPVNGRFVFATPGYPTSQAGQAFAQKCSAGRTCKSRLVRSEADRAFYVLTCDDRTGFDATNFKVFEKEYLAKKFAPRDAYHARPEDPEGTAPLSRHFYKVQIVDPTGNGVADALVKCRFPDPPFHIRKTDKDGRCQIDDWQPDNKSEFRGLTIDAPGFGVGPVPFEPKQGVLNVIQLKRQARVVGRVVDDEGHPLSGGLTVRYKRFSYIEFETDFHSQNDGTFAFNRIMPDEEFRVEAGLVRSEWMTLDESETSKELMLKGILAASLRGIVVNDRGDLVPVNNIGGPGSGLNLRLDFGPGERFYAGNSAMVYFGTNNGPWGPSDGRFGFSGMSNRPFRIKVSGWEVDPSEPIQLEPGELRFVRVTLKKKQTR